MDNDDFVSYLIEMGSYHKIDSIVIQEIEKKNKVVEVMVVVRV